MSDSEGRSESSGCPGLFRPVQVHEAIQNIHLFPAKYDITAAGPVAHLCDNAVLLLIGDRDPNASYFRTIDNTLNPNRSMPLDWLTPVLQFINSGSIFPVVLHDKVHETLAKESIRNTRRMKDFTCKCCKKLDAYLI